MLRIQEKMYPSPKAVLLDKDGTIIKIDTLHKPLLIRRAEKIEEVAKIPSKEIVLRFWGINLKANIMDVRGPFMLANKVEEQVVAAVALYSLGMDWLKAREIVTYAYEFDEALMNPAIWNEAIDTVVPFITRAAEQGIQLAILTGDTTLRAKEACEILEIDHLITFILGADKVKNDKPATDLIDAFCQFSHLSPKETIFIGDSIKDMQMAKSAGVMLAVAYESGVNTKEELKKYADHVINDYSEIEFVN